VGRAARRTRPPRPAEAAGATPPSALPGEFLARLGAVVQTSAPPGEADALLERVLASFGADRLVSFRVNPLRATEDAVLTALRALGLAPGPVPWCPGAFTVPAADRERLTRSAPAEDGSLYIQGLSSMWAALALAPTPGDEVLDLCAAPGGKTLHLAALLEGRGGLAAVEAVRPRFFRLRANLARGGATDVRLYLKDGRRVGQAVPGRFDRVLVDAPCSSEARFDARDPGTWAHWSLRKVREAARKQRGLLRSGLDALRPGGALVYCTCSFAPEENELIVDEALRAFAGEVVVAPLPRALRELPDVRPALTSWGERELDPALAEAARIFPNEAMAGFFLTRLVRA